VWEEIKKAGFRAMPLILSASDDEHASLTSRVASPPKNIGNGGSADFLAMPGTACLTMSCRLAANMMVDRQTRTVRSGALNRYNKGMVS